MSEIQTSVWSETAASNNTAVNDGWPEGQPAASVNNCAREMMAALKREWNRSHPTLTSSGANTITLTYTTAPPAYVQGMIFCFVAGATNTGAATLNVNALGAKAITKNGTTALAGGEIIATAVVTVKYDGTQFQLTSASFSAGRNWLLNGAMSVWQRGAGGSASIAVAASTTAYSADRWYLKTAANQASVVSQRAITTVTGTAFAARVQRNSGQTGTGAMYFAQPYDTDYITALIGQTVVVSAQISTGANWSPTNGTLTCTVYFGTGSVGKRGSSAYTSETNITASQNIAAGTAVAKYTFATGAVPAGTTQMEVQFTWSPTGTASANDWFQITNVQLEVGSAPTAFDAARLNFAGELAQCRRFYWKTFLYSVAPAQNAGTTNAAQFGQINTAGSAMNSPTIPYPVPMRISPTLTAFNPSAANAQARNNDTGTDCTNTALAVTGEWGGAYSMTTPGGSGVGNALLLHLTADAEI